MTAEAVREGLNLLDQFFGGSAKGQVDFFRDKGDSFSIRILPLCDGDEWHLSEKEALSLIPEGSNWEVAEGWRSFFGHSLQTRSGLLFVIGAEGILPHKDRGAYPVMRAYTFAASKIPVTKMEALANKLSPGCSACGSWRGIIKTSSNTPAEHQEVEGTIIRLAAAFYRSRQQPRLLFRTLILCASRLPRLRSSLVATVPSIERTFSRADRLRTWLRQRVG